MNNEAFKVLEFDKILELLKNCATSKFAKELVNNLMPSDDFDEVQERINKTTEAVKIFALAVPPLGGIRDIRNIIKKIKLGSVAEGEEILDVISTMYAMRNVKKFFKETEIEAPILKNQAIGIEILGNLEQQLNNAIDDHGVIKDDASIELQRIRRELKSSQAKIKEQIYSILHNANYQKYFQETIVTMRGDRYVIPVKQEYRREFPGLVHDQSATAATVFIEPIQDLKVNHLGNHNPRLHTDEVLIALSICAVTDPLAETAMQQIEKLKGCEVHSSVILAQVDTNTFRKLGVNLTCEPVYQSKKLYHK